MRLTEEELYMSLTAYGEARGEPADGIIAVCHVILTRGKKRKKSIREVCLEPKQFSCWNESDKNFKLLDKYRRRTDLALLDSSFKRCFWLARGVLEGYLPDPTNGADHYITRSLYLSDEAPFWVHKLEYVTCIGKHVFLK